MGIGRGLSLGNPRLPVRLTILFPNGGGSIIVEEMKMLGYAYRDFRSGYIFGSFHVVDGFAAPELPELYLLSPGPTQSPADSLDL